MRIEQLDFRFGSAPDKPPLSLNTDRVTVFIGPNNGGKSLTIRDIQTFFRPWGGRKYGSAVLSGIRVSDITDEEIDRKIDFLRAKSRADENVADGSSVFHYRGFRQPADEDHLRASIKSLENINNREYAATYILQHFILNLGGQDRLTLANPGGAQSLLEKPVSTQASLFHDEASRKKLSKIVHHAFGKYLVIDPTSLHQFGYSLSDFEPDDTFLKSLSQPTLDFFLSCHPLERASDGTRAFVGMLAEVIAGSQDMLFVDEPEAFLHPSLAFLLGKEIGLNVSSSKQLFVATHSPHFLMGCISSGVDMNIVRLSYDFGEPRARLLPNDALKNLISDPMMRSIGALSGLFYSGVLLTEGDTDRAFYDEINNRLTNIESGILHTLSLNAHSKHILPNLARPLRELGIPTALVFDIDWVKEDGKVGENYLRGAGIPKGLQESILQQRKKIRGYLSDKSDNYKRNGGTSLLKGHELLSANTFFDDMERYGLFTVRSGEVESWLPSVECPRTKGSWLPAMFEALGKKPGENGYIETGNDDVWDFLKRIGSWLKDKNRRGMEFDELE